MAVEYCHQLLRDYKFHFRIVKPRRTRLGDFRVLPHNQTQITVNTNLNPYAFLITYVHEVAHAAVHLQHVAQRRSRRVKPHGEAWQMAFQQLMQPLLTEAVFPAAILRPLTHYMANPGATTYSHPALILALRQFDPQPIQTIPENRVLLRDVSEGKTFQLAQKTYIRGTLRRTRVVCKEVTSGKSYAVLAHAWVSIMMNDE
ncbi:SprT-like domain-containing protein [Spirosoma foliorum]|uniref:SprT domain-containing protein n=1 Tax=Spirosoma foliorum TaxID=2710596 RepID=A0A7G5GV90_9BACT|nr:SprT-like domain-containing protein [Spirosoma foliorum]QMW02782.1 sprT domain-containing protein [Spirosoma foliorum]